VLPATRSIRFPSTCCPDGAAAASPPPIIWLEIVERVCGSATEPFRGKIEGLAIGDGEPLELNSLLRWHTAASLT
jgi:hypothetical protein